MRRRIDGLVVCHEAKKMIELVTHAPVWFQRVVHSGLRENRITRQATDSSSASTERIQAHTGYTALHAVNTTCLAHCLGILEATRWCKIEGGKCTRFA